MRRSIFNFRSGLTGVEIIVVLAVLGIAAWFVKPSAFPGASKRAANSTQATAQVEAATNAQAGAAAASVVKIGEANSTAPASPSRDFISREVPVALSRLPAPDPIALLEAEKRRSSVMEGRADEARRLYEGAAKQSAELQRERDEALAARRAADLALEQAAAADHARTAQMIAIATVALLAVAAWVYLKFHTVGIAKLGKLSAMLHAGEDPISALDVIVDERLHNQVQMAARKVTPVGKPISPK